MSITVAGIIDPIRRGIDGGWQVYHAGEMSADQRIECDVVIVGTGAGGGTAAEILTQAGLNVVMLEEGPLRSSDDFKMREAEAFRDLYQEGGGRTTKDGAFTILQGRAVGGSTTVNWTSSFRTPPETLQHWAAMHGVKGLDVAAMAPWFARAEQRLSINPWMVPANPNNDVIRIGCEALGWSWHTIPRNVAGCWNLGYCGVGCPTNAKQSMLVTTIPGALNEGASLYQRARVSQLIIENGRVAGVIAEGMPEQGFKPTGRLLTVRARHTILAGGAINNPGILLRSKATDPHERVGKRTMVHPVSASFAEFQREMNGWSGAPQSQYSDHFQWKDGAVGPMGFKVEVLPMLPAFIGGLLGNFGEAQLQDMKALGHLNGMIALMRDGFTDDSPGGSVCLRDDGSPVLDYPMTDSLADGIRRAYLAMAEMQFAAGAKQVRMMQMATPAYQSWAQAKAAIADFSIEKFRTGLGSAHLMGGCAMGEDPRTSVVNSEGQHHQLESLSIMDGSVFPTSIGANPQLSIYGLVTRNATLLAQQLAPTLVRRESDWAELRA
ncbi:MAG: GMC family oxidoreductase [Paraperlucidibaca sp.]